MTERSPVINEEHESLIQRAHVECIAPDGLGFGEGTISGKDASDEDRHALHESAMRPAEAIVPVEADDDGCGDGRCTGLISRLSPATKLTETYGRSLHRAKVFGGGLVMTAAGRIGLGLGHGRTLEQVYDDAAESLDKHGIEFGAHTDESASGNNSGCGALDKTPAILMNASKYAESIKAKLQALGADEGFEDFDAAFQDIIDNFAESGIAAANESFAGSRVMRKIKSLGKVIKQLQRGHNERIVVLNAVPGTTVNQAWFRTLTEDRAEAFATDLWRIDELAEKQYDNEDEQRTATLSEKIYTLATAATLTKGDLPTYLVAIR